MTVSITAPHPSRRETPPPTVSPSPVPSPETAAAGPSEDSALDARGELSPFVFTSTLWERTRVTPGVQMKELRDAQHPDTPTPELKLVTVLQELFLKPGLNGACAARQRWIKHRPVPSRLASLLQHSGDNSSSLIALDC